MAKTLEQLEKQKISDELQIAAAKLPSIAFVKLSTSGTHYFFADQNGNNVFADTNMRKSEFGFALPNVENKVTFNIKCSDAGDVITLDIPKDGGLAVGKNKLNKKFLELLVATSIQPIKVNSKRQAKTAKHQQASLKNVVNK